MKTIKIIGNFDPYTADGFKNYFAKQTQDGHCWNDLRVVDDSHADYYVVVNCPPGKKGRPGTIGKSLEHFDPEQTLVFQMEPASSLRNFPAPFDAPHEHRDQFLYVHDTLTHHNNIEWWLSHSYCELINEQVAIEKSRDLSAILSSQFGLEGHRLRVNFANHLSNSMKFDLYTRDRSFWLFIDQRNVKIDTLERKELGLYPYRYHFAAENTWERNYFTEKIVDPILAECLCFYWGCPNLEEFLDPQAFIRLNLHDTDDSRETVETAIQNNEWEKRLPSIRQAKQTILDELQFFPTLDRVLNKIAA